MRETLVIGAILPSGTCSVWAQPTLLPPSHGGHTGHSPPPRIPTRDRREFALLAGEFLWEPWGRFRESIETGESAFESLHGVPVFEHLQRDPEDRAVFHAAIPAGGTLLLAEHVVPSGTAYHHSMFLDLNMLVMLGAARERTRDEYVALLERAGFTLTRIVPTGSPLSLVEAAPAVQPA